LPSPVEVESASNEVIGSGSMGVVVTILGVGKTVSSSFF
jgi:hypothetical protein